MVVAIHVLAPGALRLLVHGYLADGIAPSPLFYCGRRGAEFHARGQEAADSSAAAEHADPTIGKGVGNAVIPSASRSVELTDAGKLLLEQARLILKQVEDATIGVRRRARGETGRIIVGTSGSYFHPLIVKVLCGCRTRYPNLVIAPEVEVTNIPLLIGWLRTGRVDACLVPLPIDDTEELVIEPLIDEDCVIALPHGHPQANSASAPLASLAKETFVLGIVAPAPARMIRYSPLALVQALTQRLARSAADRNRHTVGGGGLRYIDCTAIFQRASRPWCQLHRH